MAAIGSSSDKLVRSSSIRKFEVQVQLGIKFEELGLDSVRFDNFLNTKNMDYIMYFYSTKNIYIVNIMKLD